jgi:hypothetical protein
MIDYTKIPDLDELLNSVEELLTEQIGRYQAQRMIAMWTDIAKYPSQQVPRNIWREAYELGFKTALKNTSVENNPKEEGKE